MESLKKMNVLDYITKPFDIEKIKLVIRNALERKKLHEEREYYKKQILKFKLAMKKSVLL